ncbi:MAG: peptidyl-tRNA hydrolase [Candidatus Anammoxibacter sp.]
MTKKTNNYYNEDDPLGVDSILTKRPGKIKVLYRKNLKMSTDKVASQVAHAVLGLEHYVRARVMEPREDTIIVLGVSDKKFWEKCDTCNGSYVHKDKGYTEVPKGESTAIAFWDGSSSMSKHCDKIRNKEFKQLFIDEYLSILPSISSGYLENAWKHFWDWAEETGHVNTPQEYARWDKHEWGNYLGKSNPIKIERRRKV